MGNIISLWAPKFEISGAYMALVSAKLIGAENLHRGVSEPQTKVSQSDSGNPA